MTGNHTRSRKSKPKLPVWSPSQEEARAGSNSPLLRPVHAVLEAVDQRLPGGFYDVLPDAATTRVLLDSTDGKRVWGAVGVGENIIEASWQALIDGLEYGVSGTKEG